MTASTQQAPPRASRLAGYLLALAAGATWGTTGPLSTGLYALMPATSIGFWRVLLGTVCLAAWGDRKSTRLNSSHGYISYAVFCLKKKKTAGQSQLRLLY